MAIETAGQQKYADLTAKRIKSLQTGMTIIVGIVAVVYAVVNTKGRKAFNSKLDKIEDKNEFYRQIVAPDVLELKEEQLLVAKDYVIVVDADVWIYDLHHMEKSRSGKTRKCEENPVSDRTKWKKDMPFCRQLRGMEDRKRLIRCIIDCMIGLLFSSSSWLTPVMRKTWYSGSSVYGAMLEPEYQVFLMS